MAAPRADGCVDVAAQCTLALVNLRLVPLFAVTSQYVESVMTTLPKPCVMIGSAKLFFGRSHVMFARLVGWLAANVQPLPVSVADHVTFRRARSKVVMSLIVYHLN